MFLRNTGILYFISFILISVSYGQSVEINPETIAYKQDIVVGAERINHYLPLIKDKKVAVVANQTSVVGEKLTHLVDTLLSLNIDLVKVFSPEHGFRGVASAGEKVKSGKDTKTGLPIISLYGKHKKPTKEDLADIDIVLFDLQDVGTRFYTYISTMHYVMEACAEQGKQIIILDRPNPNGFYVDGPILEDDFKSFVGIHPIPVVHGLTVGELAKMIIGEKWITCDTNFSPIVIEVENYSHSDFYKLPVAPSPNLPNMASIYLYPSLCFFEGTTISVGRGTDLPFQVFGAPDVIDGSYTFKPKAKTGASSPKHEGEICVGYNVQAFGDFYMREIKSLYFYWLCNLYEQSANKNKFFLKNNFFDLLAGTDKLRLAIANNTPAHKLKDFWKKDIETYKIMRKKYLIYQDFE